MSQNDTIAAIATPPGRGGIGVLRVSGPAVADIAVAVLGSLPPPRHASYAEFRDADGTVLDQGIALYFPAPHSFTGEAVLELQGHGGPVVLDMLLQRLLRLGARMAHPGEFSERAFLNHKLDLAQAEAVADLIESGSSAAARSAMRSLQGEFSRHVHALVQQLVDLRSYVEAAIDFPEEEIDFLADASVLQRLDRIGQAMAQLLQAAQQGRLLHDGMTLVIAGRPNAGKSSLLNALAQQDSAIVSHVPGTTRDVLREHIQLDGLPLHVIDTAGLRDSSDVVEAEGIRRAQQAMQQADRVLLLVDDSETDERDIADLLKLLPQGSSYTLVRNKIDKSGRTAGSHRSEFGEELAVSVMCGDGMAQLRQHLKACMGYQDSAAGTFMARRRHVDAIERAQQHVHQGREQLQHSAAGELLAEELRLAQQCLSEITGEFTAEDLLGKIFSSFCIGK